MHTSAIIGARDAVEAPQISLVRAADTIRIRIPAATEGGE